MKEQLKTFEEYFSQSMEFRIKSYEKAGRLKHVMLSNQFKIKCMEELFDIADLIKSITKMNFIKAITKNNLFLSNSCLLEYSPDRCYL